MIYSWHFNTKRPSDKERNPIQGEFFAADAISKPGEPLVREGIQNSLDARRNGEKDWKNFLWPLQRFHQLRMEDKFSHSTTGCLASIINSYPPKLIVGRCYTLQPNTLMAHRWKLSHLESEKLL